MLITGTLNSCRKRTKFIMDLFEFAYNLYLMDPVCFRGVAMIILILQ
jgi:hypothetical protein